jgi:hypothetical protein
MEEIFQSLIEFPVLRPARRQIRRRLAQYGVSRMIGIDALKFSKKKNLINFKN